MALELDTVCSCEIRARLTRDSPPMLAGGTGGTTQLVTDGTQLVGAPHGHVYEPVLPGCQGGSGSLGGAANVAGHGGGVLNLNVHDSIRIDGLIHANGEAGIHASGGGSGGSVKIATRHVWGYGFVQAHGGDANLLAGGGAGKEQVGWLLLARSHYVCRRADCALF